MTGKLQAIRKIRPATSFLEATVPQLATAPADRRQAWVRTHGEQGPRCSAAAADPLIAPLALVPGIEGDNR